MAIIRKALQLACRGSTNGSSCVVAARGGQRCNLWRMVTLWCKATKGNLKEPAAISKSDTRIDSTENVMKILIDDSVSLVVKYAF